MSGYHIFQSTCHGTAAARAPGMGENPPERFSSFLYVQMCKDFRQLNSSNSYSLNFVDCFLGACIIVSIKTKGIHALHCLLPSYNKLTLS